MEQNLPLIKKAKLGDADAFALLYSDIYRDLYRFALYTLKNPADAEDAVGDACLDAFVRIGSLRREESFSAWMFKILSGKCKRKFAEREHLAGELPQDIPDPFPQDLAEHIALRSCFFALPDEDRLIISMHLFAGYTSREIGGILHMNENTVRSRESRALKKMARQLREGKE